MDCAASVTSLKIFLSVEAKILVVASYFSMFRDTERIRQYTLVRI